MNRAAEPAFVSPTAALSPPSRPINNALAATFAALSSLLSPSTPPPCSNLPPLSHISISKTSTTHRAFSSNTRASHTLALSLPRYRPTKSPEQESEEKAHSRVLDEAWNIFHERYVDESAINWNRLRRRLKAKSVQNEADLQQTLKWLFGHAEDPFTRYLSPEQLSAMKDDIDGEMCGVGIIFNAESHGWQRTKRVVIKDVVRKSPAADAGLMVGDRITAIDMVGVRRMRFDEATSRLLGKEGKKVLISFTRDEGSGRGVEFNVLLTRRRFEVPTVSGERLHASGVGAVGYLQVREFGANTAAQTRAAIREACGKNGVALFVLDMRGNAGGLVDKAVEVAKVFLERERVIVRFVGRDGAMTTERCGWGWFRPRVHFTKEPIVILTDGETASASELVAAALRDNCRAVVVGNCTFGKGSVQAIVPLTNGGGVAVTVARYRTPRDESIVMGKGLKPDLFKSNLAEDGDGVVKELFGRGGSRRLKWIVGRLGKCVAPGCEEGRRGIGRVGNAR